jgi:hypothetical protein
MLLLPDIQERPKVAEGFTGTDWVIDPGWLCVRYAWTQSPVETDRIDRKPQCLERGDLIENHPMTTDA